MSREVVAILYCHNHLISLVILDFQRKPLMHTDVTRREIWEWRDHTREKPVLVARVRIDIPKPRRSCLMRAPTFTGLTGSIPSVESLDRNVSYTV